MSYFLRALPLARWDRFVALLILVIILALPTAVSAQSKKKGPGEIPPPTTANYTLAYSFVVFCIGGGMVAICFPAQRQKGNLDADLA